MHACDENYGSGASEATAISSSATGAKDHQNDDRKCLEIGWKCIPVACTSYGTYVDGVRLKLPIDMPFNST